MLFIIIVILFMATRLYFLFKKYNSDSHKYYYKEFRAGITISILLNLISNDQLLKPYAMGLGLLFIIFLLFMARSELNICVSALSTENKVIFKKEYLNAIRDMVVFMAMVIALYLLNRVYWGLDILRFI